MDRQVRRKLVVQKGLSGFEGWIDRLEGSWWYRSLTEFPQSL